MFLSSFIKTIANILTTKGDVLSYSTTEARLGVGANDTVLTADSGEATGLKWATAGGGVTITTQEAVITGDITTTDTSYAIATGITLTVPNNAGSSFVISNITGSQSSTSENVYFALHDDGATLGGDCAINSSPANQQIPLTVSQIVSNNASVIALYFKVSGATGKIQGASTTTESGIRTLQLV